MISSPNSQSDALVLFGVTGDLAHKMIFPALYALVKRGALKSPVIGVVFPKWTLARLHRRVTDSIKRAGGTWSCPMARPNCVKGCFWPLSRALCRAGSSLTR